MELLSHYDFALPEALIATHALSERGSSRLLCLKNGAEAPEHDVFQNIKSHLRPGDVLVVNNTKVMNARLVCFKPTGGKVKVLLVRPLAAGAWAVLIDGKGPFLPGARLHLGSVDNHDGVTVMAKSEQEPGVYHVTSDVDLGQYAEHHGHLPLPPYFRREAMPEDKVSYQTIFAKELGAVAAPTAGLHFTDALLEDLKASGIHVVETTLHVGPGTFLPIRHENIADHAMHSEFFRLPEQAVHVLNRAKAAGNRIIPVGSTAMRVIEQAMQWSIEKGLSEFFPCHGETSIFIRPGYRFLASDAIITNFHLPKSTLLLLVSAVATRERVLKAYEEAIAQNYRFFSYGDACYFEVWK